MSDWKKLGMTWGISTLVGFYTVFVLMQLWNWFAVPLLHVPEGSYWLMYGLNMFIGLITGVGEQENPVDTRRWSMLFIVLDRCVHDDKMDELKEVVRTENEGIWFDFSWSIFGKIIGATLTLGLGFVIHLLNMG
jgi:hypothetical protein